MIGTQMRKWVALCVMAMQLFVGQVALAQQGGGAPVSSSPAAVDPDDLEGWADGFLGYAMATGRIAGAVVVVVDRNGPIFSKGYGFADVAARTPVSPDATLFRPGSVSKLLTWTAVMQQVEAGRIDLDADVNRYLDFKIPPFEGKPVTMRQIMTHTAGFQESIRYLITTDGGAVMPLEAYVKRALPERVFAPGTTPAYSNYATALAGYIVQRVSGMPFEAYIEQRILRPLAMERSTFRQPLPSGLAPMMSRGYKLSTAPAQPFEYVLPWPAGSMSATGTDMGKFMIAHLNDGRGLMKPETTRMMQDYRAPGIEGLNRMALGFYEQNINGYRAIAHGGDTTLFHSDLVLFPEAGLGIYISMNSGGIGAAAQTIRSALVDGIAKRYLPARAADRAAIDPAASRKRAEQVAGNYVASRGSMTTFLRLLGLLQQSQVVVGDNGKLQFPALDPLSAGPRDWVEIAPYIWEDRNTGEKLAAEVKDRRVVQLSVEPLSPFTVYTPAPGSTNGAWLGPVLISALALITLTALMWPIRAGVRWYFGAAFALTGRAKLAFRLSRLACWLVVVAVAGWIGMLVAFTLDLSSIGGPLDWLIQSLRILSPLAAVGLVLSAGWLFVLVLRQPRLWWTKLSTLVLTACGLVCLWGVWVYNLYGMSLVY
jgi:CubicO group peptidase (beta-lactamase class C family)